MNKAFLLAGFLAVAAVVGWGLWGNAHSTNKMLTASLEQSKATIVDLENQNADLKTQTAELSKNLKERNSMLATTEQELSTTHQSLEDTIAKAKADEDARTARIDNLNQELLMAVEARKTVEVRVLDLQKKLQDLTVARQAAEDRVAELEAKQASYEERMLALNDLQRIKSEMVRLQDENAVLVARLQKYEAHQSKAENALIAAGGKPSYIYRSSNYKRREALSLKTGQGKGFTDLSEGEAETAVTTKE